jgi:hypothetical protein
MDVERQWTRRYKWIEKAEETYNQMYSSMSARPIQSSANGATYFDTEPEKSLLKRWQKSAPKSAPLWQLSGVPLEQMSL